MSSCVQQQVGGIAFDADALRVMSKGIFNQQIRDKYDRLRQITGIVSPKDGYDPHIDNYLSKLTTYLMNHWSNNELFFIWADFRMHGWNMTLPCILQNNKMLSGVEKRFQTDPRRKCVR